MTTKEDAVMNFSDYGDSKRTLEEERLYRKQRLAASFRLFGRFGFDEGIAGHITARDPEHLDHFWVNPFGMSFSLIRVSDLIRVNEKGEVVEGDAMVNGAAFAIHSQVHAARPDVVAAAHSHSIYGKAWSSLRRKLDPLTQDSCAFYDDHALFDDYTGVVLDPEEGKRIFDQTWNGSGATGGDVPEGLALGRPLRPGAVDRHDRRFGHARLLRRFDMRGKLELRGPEAGRDQDQRDRLQ